MQREYRRCRPTDSGPGLPLTAFNALSRTGPERLDTNWQGAQLLAIADAAVDDQPVPAVILRKRADLVADQCAAQRPTAIDNQNLSRALALKR